MSRQEPFAAMDYAGLFAAIVNSVDAAVISKTLDGKILSWNPAAERIFGWTAAEMIGQSIRRIIPEERQSEEDDILARVERGENSIQLRTERIRKDGTLVHLEIMVSPVKDHEGRIIGASKIGRDITREVETRRALNAAETRFRLMADNIAQLAWIADAKGWMFWYNKRWFDYTGTTQQDVEGNGWRDQIHPDHVERVEEHVARCLKEGVEWEDTFPIRAADGTYGWFLSRAVPLRDKSGDIVCWFGTATDITERRAAERQIELLLMEVNHRSRNLLTVVQSLAERTAEHSEDFLPRLRERIAGLAANQDVLVKRNWRQVPLSELVDAQLAFLEDRLTQVERDGPDVIIQPGAAESLSMALHEMATNAEKYGALSVPEGRVTIRWRIEPGQGEPRFVLTWEESGGPAVTPPTQRGFGSRVIEDVPARKLRADVECSYDPGGFRFSLACPVSHVFEM